MSSVDDENEMVAEMMRQQQQQQQADQDRQREEEDRLLLEAAQEAQQSAGAAASSSMQNNLLQALSSAVFQNQSNGAQSAPTPATACPSPPDYQWLHNLAKNCYRRATPYVVSILEQAKIYTADDLRNATYEDIVNMGFTLAWRVPIAQFVFRLKWGRHHWDDEIDFELRPKTPPRAELPPQPPTIIPVSTPAQSLDANTPPVELERHGFANHAIPAPRLFKRGVPKELSFNQSVAAAVELRELPPGREDMAALIPTNEDGDKLVALVDSNFPEVRARPEVQALVAGCELTDDDIRALMLYNVEEAERTPTWYPVVTWTAGWLMSQRRDEKVKRTSGPLFVRMYRAMEKLPRVSVSGYRGAAVGDHKGPRNCFDHYTEIFTGSRTVSFWGPTYFRRLPTDATRRTQWYEDGVEEIIYFCNELEVVDLKPFKIDLGGSKNREGNQEGLELDDVVYPMCPIIFELTSEAMKVGNKVLVNLKQVPHADFAYLDSARQE